MRGKITKGAFAIVSPVIVFAAAFFWMGDRVTEMTIRGVGTIKPAVNTANLRHIDGPSFLGILDDTPKGEFEIVYGAEDLDSINLAYDLRYLLPVTGWRFINITAVPLKYLLNIKNAMAFPKNIKLEVHSFIGSEEIPNLSTESKPRTLYSVLAGAIMKGLGGVQTLQGATDPSLPDNRVRITVFPR
jgi:hypothetical protein